MRRREFVIAFGAAMAPRWALAQQRPTLGFLGPSPASVATNRVAAFEQRLEQLGWVNGRTLTIEYRWAEGKTERFSELAAGLAAQRVDVIATWGTETALEAKKATSLIPIVFTVVGDPVGSGLVASLASPGGNVTGISTQHPDLVGKRLELLREAVPTARRIAILTNASNIGASSETRQVQSLAETLGIQVTVLEIRTIEETKAAILGVQGKVDALYVVGDALMNSARTLISSEAIQSGLPSIHGFQEIVAAGGLISYAPNYIELFRRLADYTDKILRGAKPQQIPVEQPTKFDLVINLKTAKLLHLTIPPTLLARADEVIE